MQPQSITYLGTLGNREGINVARVEVSWYDEVTDASHSGYFIVHATGEEPECEGEYGTIYNVFENLVHEAMDTRNVGGSLHWSIEDTSSI